MARTRVDGLDVAQDLAFQRRDWVAQRVGWGVMALILIAAGAGLFGGGGPLSRTEARSADGSLRIEYERFAHQQTPTRLRFAFPADAERKGEVRLWIERAYIEKTRIEHVLPMPQRVELGSERLTYVFAAGALREAGAAVFDLKIDHVGRLAGRAGIDAGPQAAFRHFVYP